MPDISTKKVCYVIARARMFDAKDGTSDPSSDPIPTDDDEADALQETAGDPGYRELIEFIRGMDVDEQIELVALAWVGRGTYDASDWDEAVGIARDEHNARTAEYLAGLPMLGDYLEEGLAAFGESCEDYE